MFSVLTEGFIVSCNINLPIYLYSKKVNFRHLASNWVIKLEFKKQKVSESNQLSFLMCLVNLTQLLRNQHKLCYFYSFNQHLKMFRFIKNFLNVLCFLLVRFLMLKLLLISKNQVAYNHTILFISYFFKKISPNRIIYDLIYNEIQNKGRFGDKTKCFLHNNNFLS